MKRIYYVIAVVAIISCKKESNKSVLDCKLSKVIHTRNGSSDTTLYTYSGDNLSYTTRYSTSSTLYKYEYTKNGNQYDIKIYWDSVQHLYGTAFLNSQNLLDSTFLYNIINSNYNNRDKNYFNSDGYITRAISNYNTYENDIKYFYNNGNYSYWIYDLYDLPSLVNSQKDSIVFAYYLDKPKVAERYVFDRKYGIIEKNLVKSRSYYDLLNGGQLRLTYIYEYLTDANGLVTREILTSRTQPGNVVNRIDTTYFEYTCQ